MDAHSEAINILEQWEVQCDRVEKFNPLFRPLLLHYPIWEEYKDCFSPKIWEIAERYIVEGSDLGICWEVEPNTPLDITATDADSLLGILQAFEKDMTRKKDPKDPKPSFRILRHVSV